MSGESGWRVGDLALCVDDKSHGTGNGGIKQGRIYRVDEVQIVPSTFLNSGEILLVLDGMRLCKNGGGYRSFRFRPIRPDAHEACDAGFASLLKLKRAPVAAPAALMISPVHVEVK